MEDNISPLPAAKPLNRLQVRDGLKINSERWKLAHDYHRHRQNLLHQSLWEPGIVYGLGAKVINTPDDTSGEFSRGRRWIEIQPGVAIDIEGNPIIVGAGEPKDRMLHIATQVPRQGSITVRVVIRYVDPDDLAIVSTQNCVEERFRLDEISRPLEPEEIELFRIEVAQDSLEGDLHLKNPIEPDDPGPNEIDLNHRKPAKIRSQLNIRIGVPKKTDKTFYRGLLNFSNSSLSLYPGLNLIVEHTELDSYVLSDNESAQILYLSSQDLIGIIEDSQRNKSIEDSPQKIKHRIILEVQNEDVLSDSFKKDLSEMMEDASWREITIQSNLMKEPFLFGCMPQVLGDQGKLYQVGRVLVVVGDLSKYLCGDNLLRHEIREAAEIFMNLIYFCHKKNKLDNLLQ